MPIICRTPLQAIDPWKGGFLGPTDVTFDVNYSIFQFTSPHFATVRGSAPHVTAQGQHHRLVAYTLPLFIKPASKRHYLKVQTQPKYTEQALLWVAATALKASHA
jgi:hypothetical protein